MSRRIICDGCDERLPDDGAAVVGTPGPARPAVGPVPIREFHLCPGCATAAFEHLSARNLTRGV